MILMNELMVWMDLKWKVIGEGNKGGVIRGVEVF